VLAWHCVLFGESPGWEIGLGGKRYSIYCRVLHTATLALFLACLARVRIVQNTDISARCKKKIHSDKNSFAQDVLLRYSAQNSCERFSPRSRKSSSSSALSNGFRGQKRVATIASASNARLKRSLRKFCLHSSDQTAEHPNLASARPGKTRSTQILEFDHVPPSLLSRSVFASVAVRVCSRRRPLMGHHA
jgi:hypothetical protein